MNDKKDNYLNNTLMNGMKILECFDENNEALTSKEISEMLGLNSSMVWRLIYTLEHIGYLKEIPNGDKYELNYKGLNFARNILNKIEVRKEARLYIEELSEKLKLNVNLAILEKDNVILIDRVNSPEIPDNYFHIGRCFPIHCSSSGKLLLANQPKEKREEIINKIEFTRLTSNTIFKKEEFKEHLKQIREQKFAIDNEEYIKDTKCLAVPIRDKSGEVVASISISTRRLNITQNIEIKDKLNQISKTANKISNCLGFSLYNPSCI